MIMLSLATATALFLYRKLALRLSLFQRPLAIGPKSHLITKAQVPTSAGAILILAAGHYTVASVGFMIIGLIDDLLKIFTKQRGLLVWQKLVLQLAIAYFGSVYSGHYILWQILLVAGVANAVNIADGLDGLVAMPLILGFAYYGQWHLVAVLAAYLLFNNPFSSKLRLFMGDAGALAFGARLAELGLENNFWYLPLAGFVFLVAISSTVAQVASYRLTGRRLFRIAPIHHAFEERYGEKATVAGTWVLSAVAIAILSLVT